MFRNYIKVALRSIARNKVYTGVNVLGLSLGICACIAIYTISSFEFSFDTFHAGKERIYRVMGDVTESTGDKLHFARIPYAVTETGRADLSGIENISGIIPSGMKISIPAGDQPAGSFESNRQGTHYITTVIAAPQYFDIFKYQWLVGEPAVLNAPFQLVLTEQRARQYFGAGPLEKMIGKMVIYDDSLKVHVAGIVKDWDKNTDLAFTDFISAATLQSSFLSNSISQNSWAQRDMSAWTFVKLRAGTNASRINTQLAALVKSHADPKATLSLWLEPLLKMHFNADVIENPIRTAHLPTLYSLMSIALFILLLALINFINLSTAQSIQRAKEVGVRKVLGSSRMALVSQFLTEAFVLTLLAVLLAALLVNPVLYAFHQFIPGDIVFHLFSPSAILFLVLITIVTALLAGLYPAKVLSSYLPVVSLKSAANGTITEKWLLRKGLIVFQFTVSLVFITGSIVISNQLHYMRVKDLGFKSDAIITIETPRGAGYAKVAVLAQRVEQVRGVNKVALQWVSPMTENTRGMKLKFNRADAKETGVTQVAGNENFIPLYQIPLLAGRNLAASDTVREFVINKSLSQIMGDKDPAASIGKTLYWNDKPYPVVGVVSDFHTSSLHDPITPLCIINRPDRESALAIQLDLKGKDAGRMNAVLSQIQKQWKQIYPEGLFSYRFYDESLAMLYEKDRKTATLVSTAMAITIFISCMGLFGLSLFTARKKAREISIRKILGASATQIAAMLSKDVIILVVIAFFIASPLAWYCMNQWLQGFAYRVQINGWVFILAGVAALLIALLTVSFQAIKAAIINPVINLRAE